MTGIASEAITGEKVRTAMAFLASRDPVMAQLVKRYGEKPFPAPVGVLKSLTEAIVSQQISNRAAATLFSRVQSFLGEEHTWPQKLRQTTPAQWKSLGVNERKANALRRVGQKFAKGHWSEEGFKAMSEQAISKELLALPGVGPWTVAAVLIFGLARPNVFPIEDFGVRMALVALYFPDENVKTLARKAGQRRVKLLERTWEPYRTIATWLLWQSLENSPEIQ